MSTSGVLFVGGLFAGALLVSIIGLPLAHRHGLEAGRRDQVDVARIRGGWDALEQSLTAAPPSRSWAGPRALLHRAVRLRLDRLWSGLWSQPIWLGRTPLLELQPASVPPVPRVPIGAEPASGRSGLASPAVGSHEATAARTSGNAAPTQEIEAPPQTGAPAGTYPWTVYPLEPGLGYGPRHAAEPDGLEPVVAEVTGEFWEIVGSTLFEQGLLEVDATLALPCSHCEIGKVDHVGCVGCACPCKLTEVAQ